MPRSCHDHLAPLASTWSSNWPWFSILANEVQINTFLLRLLGNLVFLIKNKREDDLLAWNVITMLGGAAAILRP